MLLSRKKVNSRFSNNAIEEEPNESDSEEEKMEKI